MAHRHRPWSRSTLGALFASGAVLLSACGGNADTEPSVGPTAETSTAPVTDAVGPSDPPPDTTPPATAPSDTAPPDTAPPDTAPPRVIRGERYCEVLLVQPDGDRIIAQVFNTFPLNDCSPDAWAQLDAPAIATEFGALVALLNGPRYWLMDTISKGGVDDLRRETFGDLEMYQQATVDVTEIGMGNAPYTVVEVNRSAYFAFAAGSTVFELTDPDGRRFVMQSYSQQVDPTLDMDDLSTLGDRLAVPDGWSYAPRVLETELVVDTTGSPAVVLQDDLRNTYSLTTDSPTTPTS